MPKNNERTSCFSQPLVGATLAATATFRRLEYIVTDFSCDIFRDILVNGWMGTLGCYVKPHDLLEVPVAQKPLPFLNDGGPWALGNLAYGRFFL